MIPKIIHYCWFGNNPLPKLTLKCIESWKKYCPDYLIKCWDESNFDIHSNKYVEEAYNAKKWAFVSDYVRLWALVNEGGIYLDTDLELIRPIDFLLNNDSFSGFEIEGQIAAGIMGTISNGVFFKKLLDTYTADKFLTDDNKPNYYTIVARITSLCENTISEVTVDFIKYDNLVVYNPEFFYPKNVQTGILNITEKSVSIHHYDGSWLPPYQKFVAKCRNLLGPSFVSFMVKLKHILLFWKH